MLPMRGMRLALTPACIRGMARAWHKGQEEARETFLEVFPCVLWSSPLPSTVFVLPPSAPLPLVGRSSTLA